MVVSLQNITLCLLSLSFYLFRDGDFFVVDSFFSFLFPDMGLESFYPL